MTEAVARVGPDWSNGKRASVRPLHLAVSSMLRLARARCWRNDSLLVAQISCIAHHPDAGQNPARQSCPIYRPLLTCRTKQFHNFSPLHFLSPCARCRPRLRVRLHRIGAPRKKQLHHLNPPPTACPSQRSTPEKVVANVEARSRIEQNRGELHTHAVIARNRLMQHSLPIVGGAVMRPAARQDRRKHSQHSACC